LIRRHPAIRKRRGRIDAENDAAYGITVQPNEASCGIES
jgi:hypothetical protein